MAYTAVEAGKTAKTSKEKRQKESQKEQRNLIDIVGSTPNTNGEYLPELSIAAGTPIYATDDPFFLYSATILRKLERKLANSVAMVDVLTDESDRLKESNTARTAEIEKLKQLLKNLQAMG